MDRDERRMMHDIAKALQKTAEAMASLDRTMKQVNTNLVQIGQNMKEDTDDGASST